MLKLVGTPLSHFTRKVRIVLAELAVDHEMAWMPSVLTQSAAGYGDNPLLRIPTLHDGDVMLIDSDHIARYVVARHDASDRLGVRSERVAELNQLAVVNGIMANEVVVILAARAGLADVDNVAYFRKLRSAIEGGLAWLEHHITATDVGPAALRYADLALVCMYQHVQHYQLLALDGYPQLAARVAELAQRPSIAATAPQAALAEARAAGWSPA